MWLTTIVTVASIVAASTPTPKDDQWIALFLVVEVKEIKKKDLRWQILVKKTQEKFI